MVECGALVEMRLMIMNSKSVMVGLAIMGSRPWLGRPDVCLCACVIVCSWQQLGCATTASSKAYNVP